MANNTPKSSKNHPEMNRVFEAAAKADQPANVLGMRKGTYAVGQKGHIDNPNAAAQARMRLHGKGKKPASQQQRQVSNKRFAKRMQKHIDRDEND